MGAIEAAALIRRSPIIAGRASGFVFFSILANYDYASPRREGGPDG